MSARCRAPRPGHAVIATTVFILLLIALLLTNTAGVVLTALQMPGNWLIVAATAAFAWYRWGAESVSYGSGTLLTLLALALLGELVEFLAGALGSKAVGGSKRGAAISIVTALAGAIGGTFLIPVPIVGTLLGAALGAGLGAAVGDKWAGRSWPDTLRVFRGAAIGKLSGAAGKLAIAVAMWGTAVAGLVF